MTTAASGSLLRLADSYGVCTWYEDVTGRRCDASAAALVRVLQALGAPIDRPEGAADALRHHEESVWQRPLEPVLLAWDGILSDVVVRLPAAQASQPLKLTLRLEEGPSDSWVEDLHRHSPTKQADVGGSSYAEFSIPLPRRLPLGYHRLTLETGSSAAESLLLASPDKAYAPAEPGVPKTWGVFAPLYSLHSGRSWGAGDFGDLQAFSDWARDLGGGMVATLPLLAAFLDEPFEPGPYSPASRQFWNEFYLDLSRVPELPRCPEAQRLLDSPEFQQEIAALRAEPLVNYRRQMALKRRVLEELAHVFFATASPRLAAFDTYLAAHPVLDDYAAFRAVGERRRASWPTWPERLRDGRLEEGDYDAASKRYHLYVQWLAHEQLQALAEQARQSGRGLYLDLPLGVNPDSYDVWREREVFVQGMAGGAPPDPFFAKGQNWGFPPQHPMKMREQGYRYLTACLRHHMQLAGMLRIDHLMGLHRFFWIPHGMDAKEGVYVRYHAEELYAVFTLESQRHQTVLVGEDLGTVPPEVPPAMARHRLNRMYVVQYELNPIEAALPDVIPGAVASVNTHDMPPFAAYWKGFDIDDRVDLNILEPAVAAEEHAKRQQTIDALVAFLRRKGHQLSAKKPDVHEVLRAALEYVAAGPSQIVLASLDDLWGETQPQNVPGTWRERPNWRRRARYSLEELAQVPGAVELLMRIDRLVKAQTSAGPQRA